MASNRRKQDEKHLKILRELVSKPANRTCFDCNQKGPTYINMTIGSFVCTSCSGILRGLNPPHRVKSISMASFTSEEVDQIKSKGNQYCQAVWLGLYNGKSNVFPDTKDEHKIRDFMINKYEKKRFYVDPSVAFKNGDSFQVKSESSSSASTPGSDNRSLGSVNVNSFTSVSRPTSAIQNASSSPSLNGFAQSSTMKTSSSVDLLNSLSKNSTSTSTTKNNEQKDPFGCPVSVPQPPTESFANFDNANIFSTDDSFISCPFRTSVEKLSSHSEFPSHLPSTPDSTHSASPSNMHPDQNILPSQAHSSESPPSPGPWEGYEEELSAAMPLIPTGEIPPTYQPVHKSGSKSNVAESPVLFAAGVSAQYVSPSIDKKISENSVPRREGRASSLPLIFSESPKVKQRGGICDLGGGSSIAIATHYDERSKIKPPSPPQSMEDVFVHDDFDDLETELGPAMPLLSLDPSKGERNFEGSGCSTPQSVKNYNRNLSLPLGSSYEEQSELHDPHKRNSLTSLSSKPPSFFPSPKAIRKVFSFHNINREANETKMEKKPVPRQLSAISKKVRARLMSDEDVRVPKSLSSSLPDCTPSPLAEADRQRSSTSKADDTFLCRLFPKAEYIDMSDPVTIVYAKQKKAINQSLFFTNRSSSFQNLDYEITPFKDSKKPFSNSEDENINTVFSNGSKCADKGAYDFQSSKNTDVISSCMARPKAMHGSLPSFFNFTNNTNSENNIILSSVNAVKMSKESSGCSISMANLTNLASHFVAGASISKPTPNPSYPPFSSNPLIPHSFSSSSNTTKPPTSMSVSNLSTLGSGTNANSAQIEDRYAALKDLDEAFKSQKEVENSTSNSVVFGSPPTSSGQAQTGNVFGTSPVSGGNGFYANSSTFQNQGWNPTFPPVNPFSANGSSNTTTPWPSGSKFGNSGVPQGQQSNPFAGGTDPNLNNGQFVPNFGVSNSNTANANANNWSNFGNPSALTNGNNKFTTNPWGAGPTPNPFNGAPPPVVPPNGGSTSYNPFL